ncbi:hypothetical protein CEXT_727971 [Caerostris extrusa]|uniref:Uncharacterized protein n=1 Tax=Caerostris extrusa TaxID=172846 RepID=A0AAV4SV45_CAEEX|nr:hypothetical protein CEXT_727971 [Caerostris extrusa]
MTCASFVFRPIRRAGRSGASFLWTNGIPTPGCSKHATPRDLRCCCQASRGDGGDDIDANVRKTGPREQNPDRECGIHTGISLARNVVVDGPYSFIMTTGTVFRKVWQFTIVSCALIPLRRDVCWHP